LKYLVNLDLNKNELQNAKIQNLATAPVNPGEGQIYYNSGDKTYYGWTGAQWKDLGQVLDGIAIVALINACSSIIDDDNLSINVADALTKRHSHTNSAILSAIEVAFTNALKTKLDGISAGANKTTSSSTNGNIKIDGTEAVVYTHPGSGTNPHGTTKTDVGLGNADNKSSATIRGEITSTNVTTALGFTPIKNGGTIPEIRGGNDADKPAATSSGLVYLAIDTKKIWKDTASGVWTQMGGQDTPIATSTLLGLIKIGANLSVLEDGTLNANDNPASFIIKHERFTIAGGQTSFTLTKGTYKPGTHTIFWFLNGDKQDSDALIETSNTVVGIPSGLPDGNEVMFEYFETINANPFPNHAAEHLSSGADPIPDATTSQNGLFSTIDKTKLNNIAAGAQVNQNAFSNVKVGSTTIAADTPTDTVEFVAGTNVVITPDATNDKITIALGSAVETTTGAQTKANTAETNAKAYADTKVAGIVDSAPGTLDTLNELAMALGDDPNFATTISALIGTKETPAGAQTKANTAETNAKAYTDTHAGDAIKHITATERTSWNSRTKKYSANIGDGTSTTITVNHNLNTLDVNILIKETSSPYNQVIVDTQPVDVNNIKLLFAVAPSSGQYRVVVTG